MIGIMTACGALLACGVTMTVHHREQMFRHFALRVTGATMAGAATGMLIGIGATAGVDECPTGQVEVVPHNNAAGARGCVPHELLPEIAK